MSDGFCLLFAVFVSRIEDGNKHTVFFQQGEGCSKGGNAGFLVGGQILVASGQPAEIENGCIQRFRNILLQVFMSVQDEPYIAVTCFLQTASGVVQGLRLDVECPHFPPVACGLCEEKGVVSVVYGVVQRIAAFGKCLPQKAMGEWKDVFQ